MASSPWVRQSMPVSAVRPFRHGHNKLRINDGHVGSERVIGQGHLAPALFVGQHGKWSDFTSRSAGGGNGNQPRPVSFSVGYWITRLRRSRKGAASSSRSASGDSYLSFMIFAASMTEPPPSAMIWSAL